MTLTEKRNTRAQSNTKGGFFVNRIQPKDMNNDKKIIKLNLKDHIKSLVS
jgi:hypothetical protein